MTQALLPTFDAPEAPLLESAGFRYLTDLVYLTCERERFPDNQPESPQLQFTSYKAAERAQLADIIERTYEATLDCVGLGFERNIDDVIDGYLATGNSKASNWFIVREVSAREDNSDIGVLLLAEYRASQHMELIYVGLVPEARARLGRANRALRPMGGKKRRGRTAGLGSRRHESAGPGRLPHYPF